MKYLKIILFLIVSLFIMGQTRVHRVSGVSTSNINYITGVAKSNIAKIGGIQISKEDTWGPTNATLTLLDTANEVSAYHNPYAIAIDMSNKIISMYTDGSGDRWIETFAIEGDTIGPQLDSWEISYDVDVGNTIYYSQIFRLDSDNTERFLVSVERTGQDIDGLDEDETIMELFTCTIGIGGVITKSRHDSLYVDFNQTSSFDYRDFTVIQLNDSIYCVAGATGGGNIQYRAVKATWDTIQYMQDEFQEADTELAYELYGLFNNDIHTDSSAIVIVHKGNSSDGYVMHTYMSDQDTMIDAYDTWEFNATDGSFSSLAKFPNIERYFIDNIASGTTQLGIVVSADTVSETMTKDNSNKWAFDSNGNGRNDVLYIQNSDSLLLECHYYTNNLYTDILQYTPTTGDTLIETFADADTLNKDTSLNMPNIIYLRSGQFVLITGDATGGTKILYEMD